jgi:tetratricopeptide (TPR) repeat protein
VAEALVVEANNHFTQKHWNEAERGYRSALEIYSRTGDASGVSRTLGNLASTISLARDSQDAIALYLDSVALAREIGAKGTLCTNQCNLADEFLKYGRLDEAETAAREAVDVSRKGLNRRMQGRALACLAIVHFARRQDAVAASMWEEATKMLQAIGGAEDIEMLKEFLDRTMSKR